VALAFVGFVLGALAAPSWERRRRKRGAAPPADAA